MEKLMQDDEDFADYVRETRELEALLDDWEWAEDGVTDWGDPHDQGNWNPDNDDEDESSNTPPPPSPQDEDEDEDESNASPPPMGGIGGGEADDDEDLTVNVPQFDPDQVSDMDEMFSKFIGALTKDGDPNDFRVFTRDYDGMFDLPTPSGTKIEGIDQAVAASTGPLMKELRRLIAARTAARRLPGMRRGRLHSPNLHRIMSGDDRVFFRREQAPELDTAISLVIDCSGSMAGGKMKLAVETAYALATVLNRLDVAFEALGFTDTTTDPRIQTKEYAKELEEANAIMPIVRHVPIIMPKFKTFDERWTQPIQSRFAHVHNQHGSYGCGVPFGSTPEGCGIEFAARRLVRRQEKRKLMIVMTDGAPCGHIYDQSAFGGGWGGSQSIYQAQSRKMVKSVQASGIDIVGIGIQHNGPEAYYPNSIVINDVNEMPKLLLALLKKFMVN